MSKPPTPSATASGLSTAIALAQLLDILDHAPRGAHPAQYRAVAQSLAQELGRFDGDTLAPLLQASPAAAQVYENLHYGHAGLCRAELDASLSSEKLARELIRRAAEDTRPSTPRP